MNYCFQLNDFTIIFRVSQNTILKMVSGFVLFRLRIRKCRENYDLFPFHIQFECEQSFHSDADWNWKKNASLAINCFENSVSCSLQREVKMKKKIFFEKKNRKYFQFYRESIEMAKTQYEICQMSNSKLFKNEVYEFSETNTETKVRVASQLTKERTIGI